MSLRSLTQILGNWENNLTKMFLISVLLWALPGSPAQKSFPTNASPEEFLKWQNETRELLSGILFNGAPPKEVPLEPEFGKQEIREEYRLIQVSFKDRQGHKTSGWLAQPLKPKAEKLPLIIACHGHGGNGYEVFNPKGMYFYGDSLARKGYLVFAPNIEHEYLEGIPPRISWRALPKNVPFPWMGQRVWMIKRAIDLMLTQPGVDPEKIGIIGLSNGGLTAMFASAYDLRIKLCIASGSLIMHERMWHKELIHCRCQYLYQMDGVLDYYDIFALIAPRALLIQNGFQDPIFPVKSSIEAFEYIKKAYLINNATDRLAQDIHNGAHEFRMELPLGWLNRFLPFPNKEISSP